MKTTTQSIQGLPIHLLGITLLILAGLIIALVENEWLLSAILAVALLIQLMNFKAISLPLLTYAEEDLISINQSVADSSAIGNDPTNQENTNGSVPENITGPPFSPIPSSDSKEDKFFEEGAKLVKDLERASAQLDKDPELSSYFVEKLIDMLERCGADLIFKDENFDIRRHEAVPPKPVARQAAILETLRPGLCKGNRVFLKAKVRI